MTADYRSSAWYARQGFDYLCWKFAAVRLSVARLRNRLRRKRAEPKPHGKLKKKKCTAHGCCPSTDPSCSPTIIKSYRQFVSKISPNWPRGHEYINVRSWSNPNGAALLQRGLKPTHFAIVLFLQTAQTSRHHAGTS